MNIKKNNISVIFLLIATFSFLFSGDMYLMIPVRVYQNGEYVNRMTAEDFSLRINGRETVIEELMPVERSAGDISRPRNFILQFNLTDYGKNISDGISFFVVEVLKPADKLLVWSPVKIYRMDTGKSAQEIIADIDRIVKQDSVTYRSFKENGRKNLASIIDRFNQFIPSEKDGQATASNIIHFLNSFEREWKIFKTRFLLPDTRQYLSLFSLLSSEYPGEKYLINFQQREMIPSPGKYSEAKKVIDAYLSQEGGTSMAKASPSIAASIKMIDRSILFHDDPGTAELAGSFTGSNISYNLVLFHSCPQTGDEDYGLSPDMEGMLKNISVSTGGLSVITNDLRKGIGDILKKTDHYYDLVFRFDGEKGGKKIDIETAEKDTQLYFRREFFPEEVDRLIRIAEEEKIGITDVTLNGHDLSFSISGFLIPEAGEKAGLVKVEIDLIDRNINKVMSKSNTLRAEKGSVGISLKIAPEKKGFFKLEIRVTDLNTQKNAVFSNYIELK